MLISEIFTSIQGEGISVGVPCVFVRVAECNLRCTWCDTKYTWDWDNHDRAKEVTEIDRDAVIAKVIETSGGARTVVITGGEPMLQREDVAIIGFELRGRGFRVEIETSGSIEPTEELRVAVDQWNVSPKLASSGNKLSARLRPVALQAFAALDNAFFKFVICAPEDVDEVRSIATTYAIDASRITLMPEGRSAAELDAKSKWLVDVCTERGFRLGTRLHVLLWGSERGK